MEVSGQLHAPAALPLGKSLWYPLDRIGPTAGLDVVVEQKKFPAAAGTRTKHY